MNALQSGAERNHVEMRELLKEESTFQTSVDCLDGGSDTVEFLVSIASDFHDGRLHVGLPSGIAFAVFNCSTCDEEEGFNLISDVPFARIDRATLACSYNDSVVSGHFNRCEVGRCFNKTFKFAAHRNDTVRSTIDGADKVGRSLLVDSIFRLFNAFEFDFESGFDACVFVLNLGDIFVESNYNSFFV